MEPSSPFLADRTPYPVRDFPLLKAPAVTFLFTAFCALTAATLAPAQQPARPSLEHLTTLAESGNCKEPLPQLRKAIAAPIADPALKRRLGVAAVRCSMSANDPSSAAAFLTWLSREFPHDPAVLYLSSHVYSDLSLRASNELLSTAPGSIEVHQLNAEALETVGKWKEAEEEYRIILRQSPATSGIHYRLGRLLLSAPDPPANVKESAQHEFEEELKIDPRNAGAEFVLGELARQSEQWPDAIAHFSKASKLDVSFVDAYLGLGRALLASGDSAAAVPPLQTAARLQPDNPVILFQLATAYRRAGRVAEADRTFQAHQRAAQKDQQRKDEIKKQVNAGAGLASKP